jgi:hypothetical protein
MEPVEFLSECCVMFQFRNLACRAALAAALVFTLTAAAAACDGDDCPAKPLDITKFMREQAASTRTAEPHRGAVHVRAAAPVHAAAVIHSAKPRHHRVVTARKSAPLPTEASGSFAAQSDQNAPVIPVMGSGDFNAIDQAAAAEPPASTEFPAPPPAVAPAPAETTGAAASLDPDVQMVVADEFNEIDSKATDTALTGNGVRIGDMPKAAVHHSWLGSIWGALGNTFAALAAAVHHLTGFL